MTDNRREIRISIKEPSPGWWVRIKDLAVRHGCFVSHLVVRALEEYVDKHDARPQRRRIPYRTDRSNGEGNHGPH